MLEIKINPIFAVGVMSLFFDLEDILITTTAVENGVFLKRIDEFFGISLEHRVTLIVFPLDTADRSFIICLCLDIHERCSQLLTVS
jgi:hypothetical protein